MPVSKLKPVASAETPNGAPAPTRELEYAGQRRLVRPHVSEHPAGGRGTGPFPHGTPLTSRSIQPPNGHDSSYAEVFYFQKQIQAQTRMVVVLENDEHIEGVIEWYDRYAIKLRSLSHSNSHENGHTPARTRVLIYKDAIRYIYKAGENAAPTMS